MRGRKWSGVLLNTSGKRESSGGLRWRGGRLQGDDIGMFERFEDQDGGFAISGFHLVVIVGES